jgi:hypothetical protein
VISELNVVCINSEKYQETKKFNQCISVCIFTNIQLAKKIQFVSSDSPLKYAVIAGLKNGSICALSFPNSFGESNQDISKILQASGEKVQHFILGEEVLVELLFVNLKQN